MNSKFLLALVVIIVVILAGYALTKNQVNNVANTNPASTVQTVSPTKGPETTVNLTKNGFEPQEINIKAGTRVIWLNKSGGPATVNSDVHPTHLLFPFLNLGEFSNGSSVQVVFSKPGTYTYHNHLRPEQRGRVVVK